MHSSWPSENLLLGLLAEQPSHGYELAHLVCSDEVLRAIWHLKRSEVYFLLRKLLAQGYVAESADPAEGPSARPRQLNGPPRQIMEVTSAGRAALEVWLAEPVSNPRELRAAFLAKLYLAQRRDPALALTLLERQREVLRQRQERLLAASPAAPFLVQVHKLRQAQIAAALNALDEIYAITCQELAQASAADGRPA